MLKYYHNIRMMRIIPVVATQMNYHCSCLSFLNYRVFRNSCSRLLAPNGLVLRGANQTMFARRDFFGCDNPEIQSAAEGVSRWTAEPYTDDVDEVVRSWRCRRGFFRHVLQIFPFGGHDGLLCEFSDAEGQSA